MRFSPRVRMGAGVAAGVVVFAGLVYASRQGPSDVDVSSKGTGVLLPSSTVPGETTIPTAVDATSIPPAPTTATTTFLRPPNNATIPGGAGPTTTFPSTASRRLVVQSTQATTWKLFVSDKAGKHCVELETKGKTFTSLLCGVTAAKRPVGDLVVVDVGGGERAVVAVVTPAVTGLGIGASSAGPDPVRQGVSYAAGVGPTSTRDPLVTSGENTVARLVVPGKAGTVAAAKVTLADTKPYGFWTGYRRAGTTGLLWGGEQEVGFYDGSGGVRCVLYRRFGGDAEAQLADACPEKIAGTPVPLSTLIPTRSGGDPKWFNILAVADQPVDSFTCRLPSGDQCLAGGSTHPPEPVRLADAGSSGRVALADGVSPIDPAGADHVTLIFTNGGTEVARRDVSVP
jgi:hypothetical protein